MKKLLPDLIAILAFIILSFAYFFPADIEGRILFQHDSVAGVGAGQESKEYRDRTGERTRWTNAIFGGMPTYQMSPSYDSTKALSWVEKLYHYTGGAYLEICDVGLYSAYDCGCRPGVPEEIPVGWDCHSFIHCSSDSVQPYTDELLLYVCHPVYRRGLL